MHDEFLTALKTRREYCRSLVELARHQDELIRGNEYPDLLQVLSQKQRVIELMHEVSQPFGNVAVYWRRIREGLQPSLRTACEDAINAAEALLAEALAIERTSTDLLIERRNAAQRELRDLSDFAAYSRTNERGGHALNSFG